MLLDTAITFFLITSASAFSADITNAHTSGSFQTLASPIPTITPYPLALAVAKRDWRVQWDAKEFCREVPDHVVCAGLFENTSKNEGYESWVSDRVDMPTVSPQLWTTSPHGTIEGACWNHICSHHGGDNPPTPRTTSSSSSEATLNAADELVHTTASVQAGDSTTLAPIRLGPWHTVGVHTMEPGDGTKEHYFGLHGTLAGPSPAASATMDVLRSVFTASVTSTFHA